MAKFFKDNLPMFREDEEDAITAFNTTKVQEFQLIIHGILTEGMVISESFQVATIIEKLPLLGMTSRTILSI
ncbi:hypothetical protein J1N35_015134 [Gossypium stocksii]|uniref:Uncharacterized protein n=1 Tax=Gossypium stocksii TaxID=47602 RepID=A0A9D3VW59_9ROSI|nr:hypothetical protein J1N35_015134 [Gossypium stocksii]